MGYPRPAVFLKAAAGRPLGNKANIWAGPPDGDRKDCCVKNFSDLTEQEVLALAITNEEEDSRIYRGFAEGLREQFPASASSISNCRTDASRAFCAAWR